MMPHSRAARLSCDRLRERRVSHSKKLVARIISGDSDANVRFSELCALLERLGFERTTRGSHNVFRRSGVRELINLQEESGNAKPYQVRQVRRILLTYGLSGRGTPGEE